MTPLALMGMTEFVLNKPGGVFDVEGVNFDQAKMKMVIGEYSNIK